MLRYSSQCKSVYYSPDDSHLFAPSVVLKNLFETIRRRSRKHPGGRTSSRSLHTRSHVPPNAVRAGLKPKPHGVSSAQTASMVACICSSDYDCARIGVQPGARVLAQKQPAGSHHMYSTRNLYTSRVHFDITRHCLSPQKVVLSAQNRCNVHTQVPEL